MQTCTECQIKFDFDEMGLRGPNNIYVCGSECAKRSASSRGNAVAIHDHDGNRETNADGTETCHLY